MHTNDLKGPVNWEEYDVNGARVAETVYWEIHQNFMRDKMKFTCGFCSRWNTDVCEFGTLETRTGVKLLSVVCKTCGTFNVFKKTGFTYLAAPSSS